MVVSRRKNGTCRFFRCSLRSSFDHASDRLAHPFFLRTCHSVFVFPFVLRSFLSLVFILRGTIPILSFHPLFLFHPSTVPLRTSWKMNRKSGPIRDSLWLVQLHAEISWACIVSRWTLENISPPSLLCWPCLPRPDPPSAVLFPSTFSFPRYCFRPSVPFASLFLHDSTAAPTPAASTTWKSEISRTHFVRTASERDCFRASPIKRKILRIRE